MTELIITLESEYVLSATEQITKLVEEYNIITNNLSTGVYLLTVDESITEEFIQILQNKSYIKIVEKNSTVNLPLVNNNSQEAGSQEAGSQEASSQEAGSPEAGSPEAGSPEDVYLGVFSLCLIIDTLILRLYG